ncbi:MAG: glycine cleavage T C-terminal barrel domain-containing protein, partial [Bacteroidia bacterium]
AHEGKVVGTVTSGSMSPLLNKGIGMGYVPAELSAIGTELDIMIRNKPVRAEVVKRPFITK